MKKIFVVLISLFVSFSAFSENFLSNRFFEVEVDVPLSISNNTFGVFDYLKPEIMIDLTQIAENMSDDGFSFIAKSNPSVNIGFNFDPGIKFGVDLGFDIYSSIGIDKSLFDFLGKGNNLNEELDIDLNTNVDVFMYAGVDLGWNAKKWSFIVTPYVYSTLLHATTRDSYVKFINESDGTFAYAFSGNIDVFTDIPLYVFQDYKTILSQYQNFLPLLWNNTGFDVEVNMSYEMYKYLTLNADIRCPIFPSRISKKIPITSESKFSTSLDEISSGSFTTPSFDYKFGDIEEEEYVINRPMKVSIGGNFHPFNDVMEYYGLLGVGIEHPFTQNISDLDFYIDYQLGTRVGFVNLLCLYLQTERIDKIYSHKLMVELNLRYLELNLGIAAQSSDFVNSFKGAGLGAFVTVTVGL